ncbi:MAG: membrane protein insertase YidC [Sulfurospirillaceae bacterium]|nr:membrane protein insertase YidC [Sulfurospirillaceae bacterium]
MLDKLSNQNRIIIATVLSFLFFATYDYFFIPKPVHNFNEQNSSKVEKNATINSSKAPVAADTSSNVPSKIAKTPTSTVKNADKILATVKSKNYELEIDSLGRITKFYLNDKKYLLPDGHRLQLVDHKLSFLPLEIRFSDEAINTEAFATSYSTDKSEVELKDKPVKITLTQDLPGVKVKKELTFYNDGHYDVNVVLDKNKEYFITPGYHPSLAKDHYTFHGALLKKSDGGMEIISDGDAKQQTFKDVKFAGNADKYYATVLYNFKTGMTVVESPEKDKIPALYIKGTQDLKLSGYIGPKEFVILNKINPGLTDLIEYGFFTFISKPLFVLLSMIHSYLGNWGWAIVVLTFLIRLVLFPLTYKGMVSMNKMKILAPKMKELQAKYKGDKQKLNAHMMELYKKHGANPMGGCLPMILQIPVFFAIYRVLQNAVELKGAPWIFWIHDLAVMDPYFILPVLMGLSMFIQQRLAPNNFTDKTQEKIMKFLPLIFTFFFVTFPAGLTLYWFVSNLFSIAQQTYVNKAFEKHRVVEEKATK